ncbi:amidohydrolase family protein [Embleya hyalina]|uniref:TRZ/ATZ family hydrolase n=1 Tax=Embleya hyalina TaxID=516124 RepID=A0A401Z1Z4_9ACTN|nr:amidohydrolase family protein [Embleya hyalina]GCE00852.1 TRZ/ATZ family hydrolase [Embleya hyalina]
MTKGSTLIRNGRVVTMDDSLGTLEGADILIEDGVITAIGSGLEADDAEVIDATGKIVAPGFIDTHRHTWQAQMRGICGDWTLGDYISGIRFTISPAYTPDDVYLGNHAGALEALDAGVTTLLDFSHCNNTPDHSDAAIRGLRDSGIRGVFGYGFFDSSPQTPQHFTSHRERVADFHRIADTLGGDDLIRVGAALAEMAPLETTRDEIEAARARNSLIVTHTGCIWAFPTGVAELENAGLIDGNQVHVHCNTLSDDDWAALARHDAKISISPETELNMGMGLPVFEQAKRYGLKPTLSADVVSFNSGDLFHQLRLGVAAARWSGTKALNAAGIDPDRLTVTAHEALTWVTVNAAEAMGLSDLVGSIAVGKRADLMLVGGSGRSQHPASHPESTLVFQTSAGDVETVMVDGNVVKRDGRLVGIDRASLDERLERSAAEILGRVSGSGRRLPGTPPGGLFRAVLAGSIDNEEGSAHVAR